MYHTTSAQVANFTALLQAIPSGTPSNGQIGGKFFNGQVRNSPWTIRIS